MNIPMLGASGALFGLLAGFAMKFPNQRILLLIPPIPIKAKYFVAIYAGIELYLGLGSFNTGIAHFAHLGGAIAGFLLILFWRKTGRGV
jgi:membrane associated rhomboid family serine protease